MKRRNLGFGYQRIAEQTGHAFGLQIDEDSLWSADFFRCESILLPFAAGRFWWPSLVTRRRRGSVRIMIHCSAFTDGSRTYESSFGNSIDLHRKLEKFRAY